MDELAKKAWKVRCRNCGEPIVWDGQDRTGWTHGDPESPSQWIGRRCAGGVTGATPDTDRLAAEAYEGHSAPRVAGILLWLGTTDLKPFITEP